MTIRAIIPEPLYCLNIELTTEQCLGKFSFPGRKYMALGGRRLRESFIPFRVGCCRFSVFLFIFACFYRFVINEGELGDLDRLSSNYSSIHSFKNSHHCKLIVFNGIQLTTHFNHNIEHLYIIDFNFWKILIILLVRSDSDIWDVLQLKNKFSFSFTAQPRLIGIEEEVRLDYSAS